MRTIDPLFQSNPDMMKPTRLLIVDHNVCRYHSFDLIMWVLHGLAANRDMERFAALKPMFHNLINPDLTFEDRIIHLKKYARSVNPADCFEPSAFTNGEFTDDNYEDALARMMGSGDAWVTSTDMALRLDPLFDRRDFSGYILRYPNDSNRPIYYDKLTVFEHCHVRDVDTICRIVIHNRINAIMLDSVERAIAISYLLKSAVYQEHITFMIAHYGYNFITNDAGEPVMQKFNEVLGELEIACHHEYGYFDPFTSISNQHFERS